MKVLQIIDSLEAGGAERMAVNIANGLQSAGHESHLCVSRREGLLKESISQKVSYLFLEKKGKLGLSAIFRLNNYLRVHQIEVIHAHSTSAFIAVAALFFLKNKPKLVWHDHYGKANELQNRPVKALKSISKYFDAIISVNPLLKAWSLQELKCKQVTYLENFATTSSNVQLSLPLKGTKGKRIICLANLREQKDHPKLIEAFSLISQTKQEWTLHLCGQDFNDAYSLKVKNLIIEKNLQNHIFLLGSRSDVSAILNECDVAVLSSKSEGLPVALLEYGLYQLPVITTDVGACAEVIKEYGIIVPPQDTVALSQAMMEMIQDERKRKTLASKFHHHVLNNYGSERYVKKLMEVYVG